MTNPLPHNHPAPPIEPAPRRSAHARLRDLLAARPVILAPMEDVSDRVFRRLCRGLGAEICVTEFASAEQLIFRHGRAQRKIELAGGDEPTGIQIYGSDAENLALAARVAEAARPAFIDINCGCWIPKVARRGAGSGWLRDPDAMVAMARLVVESVALPVTVKTRVDFGREPEMPIVDLARRLEDAGVSALTIHCRTALMGHHGEADWSWARRAREATSMPVIVNGDVRTAGDVVRAFDETGCVGVMIGRAAMAHPWIFREARALVDHGVRLPAPTAMERLALCRAHYLANVAARTEPLGVQVTRRHLVGYLHGVPGEGPLRRALYQADTLARCIELIDEAAADCAQ